MPLVKDMPNTREKSVPQSTFDVMKKLLSKETLNVMQLLGFNFKQAIGVPLTRLLSDFTSNQSPAAKEAKTQHDAFSLQMYLGPHHVPLGVPGALLHAGPHVHP